MGSGLNRVLSCRAHAAMGSLSKCLERVLSVRGTGHRADQSLPGSSPGQVQEMQEETDDKKQGASTFTCIQKALPSSKQKTVIINIQIPDGSNTEGGYRANLRSCMTFLCQNRTCQMGKKKKKKNGPEVSLTPKSCLPQSMADLSA